MVGALPTCDDEGLRALVAKALSRVPKDVADHVIGDVLFIPGNKSFIISKEFLKRVLIKDDGDVRAIIVIGGNAIERGDIREVLHEVAHYWLGHADYGSLFIEPKEDKRQEEEADELVEKWMKENKG